MIATPALVFTPRQLLNKRAGLVVEPAATLFVPQSGGRQVSTVVKPVKRFAASVAEQINAYVLTPPDYLTPEEFDVIVGKHDDYDLEGLTPLARRRRAFLRQHLREAAERHGQSLAHTYVMQRLAGGIIVWPAIERQ